MKDLFATIALVLLSISGFSQNGSSSLTINGSLLKDNCGETILLRGVNHGNIWTADLGIPEFAEIALTKANCVRICLERTYVDHWDNVGNPVYADLGGEQIDRIVQAALDLKLIPIVELHDFTDGSAQNADVRINLKNAVLFWTRPDVMAVLKKHSQFLILNVANEPEHWENTFPQFFDACSSAIKAIRDAGLKVPIMLDAMHWGQDEAFFLTGGNGANLIAADNEHKLLFSVHTYWADVSDAVITSRFADMFNSGLPFVIGEFAYDLGEKCTTTINYHLIMDLCQQYQTGYLFWWWGFFDKNSNNCLSMTPDGTFDGLAGQGKEVAVTDANSIMNTSIKPKSIVDGSCSAGNDGTGTLVSGGISRKFRYHAPGAGVAANLPMMLVFHGDYSNGAGVEAQTGFNVVADANEFLVVYPDALNETWNRYVDKVPGDAGLGNPDAPDDVQFISDLIDYFCATYHINTHKVYASGHSAGGFMCYNLAIQLSGKIAAFAPVSASLWGDEAFLNDYFANSYRAVPIYHIHGDADGTVDFPDPDHTPGAWSEWPLTPFSYANCLKDTYFSTTALVAEVNQLSFCNTSKEVYLIQIVGGGHEWPDKPGYNAAQAIWNFCNAYSLDAVAGCAVNVTENEINSELTVFPNPSDGTFTINSFNRPVKVNLFDVLGNEIYLTKTVYNSYSFANAGAGIYFIIVTADNGRKVIKKIIVQ